MKKKNFSLTPSLGVCYYPEHWDNAHWSEDIAIMKKIGIKWVRIGEFAWSRIEPTRNKFNVKWLEEILDLFYKNKIMVIFGTPTATPPKWLIDEIPSILARDEMGNVRQFGSRRHYCFSSEKYLKECRRIITFLLKKFHQHPAIKMWQTDNEYSCHDTTLSYSDNAKMAFRKWLQKKYNKISLLNEAWGNVFWSMEYNSFNEIDLPHLTPTEANPSHLQDFHRFSSDQLVRFNREQTNLIKKFNPTLEITHNFMGFTLDFDHYKVAEDLTISSWDAYPLGYLQNLFEDTEHKKKYLRVGDPDFQAFHHDLYRSLNGRFGVMEQQPGAVNWAKFNPNPSEATLRMWVWEAFAHGASFVNFFRFRQSHFAQEQMHEGVLLPNRKPNKAYRVIKKVSEEIANIQLKEQKPLKEVGIILDYESYWSWQIQPQGKGLNYFRLIFSWYHTLRKKGLNVHFLSPTASDLKEYKLIIASGLTFLNQTFVENLAKSPATILLGPRVGSKTSDFQIPENLPPEHLQTILNFQVQGVETTPPEITIPLKENPNFHFTSWREYIEIIDPKIKVKLTTNDNNPALIEKGNLSYVTGIPNKDLMEKIIDNQLKKAKLSSLTLPDSIRLVKTNDYLFFTNYGGQARSLKKLIHNKKIVLGEEKISPSSIAIVKNS